MGGTDPGRLCPGTSALLRLVQPATPCPVHRPSCCLCPWFRAALFKSPSCHLAFLGWPECSLDIFAIFKAPPLSPHSVPQCHHSPEGVYLETTFLISWSKLILSCGFCHATLCIFHDLDEICEGSLWFFFFQCFSSPFDTAQAHSTEPGAEKTF